MTKKPPVALFCFSKDLDNFLDVEMERKIIEDTLHEIHASHRLTVIVRTSVSINDVFDLFEQYRERIMLFHFGGHADGKGLVLNATTTKTEKGHVKGLADLFKREVEHGQLQVIFLNGCNTAAQFEDLKAAGVPNIIGTRYPVNDSDAIGFAYRFYKSLANKSTSVTIQQAFDDGIAYLKARGRTPETIDRGFIFDDDKMETPSTWELEPKNAEWTFPTEAVISSEYGINPSEYVLPIHKYNWFFRWLPFLDFKQHYWQILDDNSFFTKANLKQIFKLYITPSQYRFDAVERQQLLQDFGSKKGKIEEKIGHQNILHLLKYGFLANDGKRPVLILADTGMGKTTLLQKLFVEYARTYPKYQLAFIYSGENTIAKINAIKDKANTVLFLDALDEEVTARQNLHQYIDNLTEAVTDFRKVFVTCRNQFFKSNSEEWQHLKGKTDVYRIELLAFTTDEAKAYINKHPMPLKIKQTARQIFNKNQSFFTRPLLLSYLEFLAENTKYAKTYEFLYQVYEAIIDKLGKREAKTTQQDKTYNRTYTKDLIAFSKRVVQQLYENTDFDLAKLAKEKGLKVVDAQSRSLLTRNRVTDTFEFTHRSFQEYFWAELFFDQTFREENTIDGSPHTLLADTEKYPYTLQFYNEMVWSRIAKVKKASEVTINGQVVDLGSNQLKKLPLVNDVNALFTLPNRQIRAFAIKYKDDLFINYSNSHGIQLTNTNISHFFDIAEVQEPIEFGYQLIKIMTKKDTKEHYFFQYKGLYDKDLEKKHPSHFTNIFINLFFKEVFNFLKKSLNLENIQATNIWELKNLNSLNLHNKNLKRLPSEILLFQNLNELILSFNQLSYLPIEIKHFKNLSTLDLGDNHNLNLEDALKKIKYLKKLRLDWCELKNVPNEIGLLSTLEELNLKQNYLEYLPKTIGKLDSLKVLTLNYNRLINLPSEIGQLQNLTKLDLWNNKLQSLPLEIGQLHNLIELNLWENKLTELPSEIGHLCNLKTLILSVNQLTKLPSEFGNLKKLNSLYVGSNQLQNLPVEIGKLKNLELLDLGNNQLTSFPQEIGELQSLNSLDLSGNKLKKLPSIIGKLYALNSLDLSNNQLTMLPSEISSLYNLNSLDLSNNQLTILPSELCKIKTLKSLNLSNNQLKNVSFEIGYLQNLNSLNLSNNQLNQINPNIGQLVSLNSLYLNDNQLISLPFEIQYLQYLNFIDLSNNIGLDLEDILKKTKQLQNLTTLDLSSNNLITLPTRIGEFHKLHTLSLRNNKKLDLVDLIKKIKHLDKLHNLDLSDNNLITLPTEIKELHNLQFLNLSGNDLFLIGEEVIENLLPNCKVRF